MKWKSPGTCKDCRWSTQERMGPVPKREGGRLTGQPIVRCRNTPIDYLKHADDFCSEWASKDA